MVDQISSGQPMNSLDAWAQQIDSPPHQVGGRARMMMNTARYRQGPNPQAPQQPAPQTVGPALNGLAAILGNLQPPR